MADVTISALGDLIPTTGLFLPVSDASTTGKVTLSQVRVAIKNFGNEAVCIFYDV